MGTTLSVWSHLLHRACRTPQERREASRRYLPSVQATKSNSSQVPEEAKAATQFELPLPFLQYHPQVFSSAFSTVCYHLPNSSLIFLWRPLKGKMCYLCWEAFHISCEGELAYLWSRELLETWTHRTAEVERDVLRSSSPTHCSEQDQLELFGVLPSAWFGFLSAFVLLCFSGLVEMDLGWADHSPVMALE